MVLGLTAGVTAAGGSWLWSYNRENYKFDREMRQKNEFKILEFRNAQSGLWREDIRDIISLTEKKMDAYLIIAVLQLDACIGLFTEGRLEPGTPPWLLQFYMMTLSAAFMFLLMSAWFAMHASVVAQCSSVRLLTQFVRLPVPTWNQLEDMRTYASSYEKIHPAHWFRAPFTRSMAPNKTVPASGAGAGSSSGRSAFGSPGDASRGAQPTSSSGTPANADPWGLETHGDHRGLYELTEQDPALRRHVLLARRAAARYQCFDAFARVSMTFGTNQFLCAIGYYSLGYVAVQDGAPWVAWGVVIIMSSIAVAMVAIDFSLTRCEQLQLQALIVLPLGSAAVCTSLFQVDGYWPKQILTYLIPIVYILNAMWMWRALRACGITEQANGALLPMKFRAVLYLDVFGWLVKSENSSEYVDKQPAPRPLSYETTPDWKDSAKDKMTGSSSEYGMPSASGPSGQIHAPPDNVWESSTYAPHLPDGDEDVVTGHDKIQPGRMAAHVFQSAAWLLIVLWLAGMCLPLSPFKDYINPLVADVFVTDASQEDTLESGMQVTVGEDVGGMPELMPVVGDWTRLPMLPGKGEAVKVSWPAHASFVPHAISSSPDGSSFVISDDFNVYYSRFGPQSPEPERQLLLEVLNMPTARHAGLRGLSAVPDPSTPTPSPENGGNTIAGIARAVESAVAASFQSAESVAGAVLFTTSAAPSEAARAATHGLDKDMSQLSLRFAESGACPALEGQAIKDMAVLCGSAEQDDCRLIVLTGRGLTLHECALAPGAMPGLAASSLSEKQRAGVTWAISQDWLRLSDKESVVSIAVNDDCWAPTIYNHSAGDPLTHVTQGHFVPRHGGCLVVGTSLGRLVQMRQALANPFLLVPERVMHQRAHPCARGSLTFVNGKYVVALWSNFNSITVFDASEGSLVREWRLPDHLTWLMLTRGGSSLYVLGIRMKGDLQLYRFPAPPELLPGAAREATDVPAAYVAPQDFAVP